MINKARTAAQARRLHRRRGGQDPARLPDPAGREDRQPDPARQGGGDPRADGGPAPQPRRRQIVDPKLFPRLEEYTEEFYSLRQRKGITRTEAELAIRNVDDVRQHDGAAGRRRRADRRAHHALSRYHPPRPAGDRAAARTAARGRRVPADHAQGRHLLPGRRHGEYRADRRRSGRDRHHGGGEGAALQSGAARGHAELLQLRQHTARRSPTKCGAPSNWCDSGLPA